MSGFTPDQRFFHRCRSVTACGDERPELKRANAITNPHSPNDVPGEGRAGIEHAAIRRRFRL